MNETFDLSLAVMMMVSGVVGIALHRAAAEAWAPGLARLGIRIDRRVPSWFVIGGFWGGAVLMERMEQLQWEWIPFGKRIPSRPEIRDLVLGMLLLMIGLVSSMGLIWLLVAKSLAEALLS